jgi:hypothetical protein
MARKIPTPVGEKYGQLTVLGDAEDIVTPKLRSRAVLVQCDCGNKKAVRFTDLRSGNSTSCGCKGHEQIVALGKSRVKHGMYGTPEYGSWSSMIQRCTNPALKAYKYYGGRGIAVCEQWRDFEQFLKDMGPRPAGTSLDRYPDMNGDYEPGNCRWATRKEQGRNTRWVKINEEIASDIRADHRKDRVVAEQYGIARSTVNHIKNGRTWIKGD